MDRLYFLKNDRKNEKRNGRFEKVCRFINESRLVFLFFKIFNDDPMLTTVNDDPSLTTTHH